MTITWRHWNVLDFRYHEDRKLEEGDPKYDFWYKRGLSMLNVNNITVEDEGQYMCVAHNSCGEIFTIGELNVLGERKKTKQSKNIK